jgi:PQQ-dependent catabolism-associated CXXCW motif protein
MDHYRDAVPESVKGGSVVHVAALPALIAAEHPVLIDVLPAPTPPPEARPGLPRMPLPHKDLPGSLWLPEVGRGALSPQTDTWFRNELAQATGHDLNKPVVFYCLSKCWMSWNATRRAISYGYTHAIWLDRRRIRHAGDSTRKAMTGVGGDSRAPKHCSQSSFVANNCLH